MNGLTSFLKALLACSASMAVVTLLALAVSPLLERRYRRGALYALWLAVALGFLVPVRPKLPQRPAVVVSLPASLERPLAARLSQTPAAVRAPRADAQPAAAPQASAPRATPGTLLSALYLLGAALSLALPLARHLRFMRTVRRFERPVSDEATLRAYREAARAMGVRRPPALHICPAVRAPMLAGLFRPRVLLPENAPAGDALSMVLRHELTHYRRGDLPLRMLLLAARAMHFFNPAVYLCERAAIHYGELSCDERAVSGTGRDQRAAYSGAILDALRRRPGSCSALTTAFSADKRLLKRRLIAMMDMRKKRRGAFVAVLALLVSAVLGANLVLADGQTSGTPSATVAPSATDAPSETPASASAAPDLAPAPDDGSVQAADEWPAIDWHATPMTEAEMLAIYEDSTSRMRTVAYWDDERDTQAQLEAEWDAAGAPYKEDLAVCTLPGEGDMPYDLAYDYAVDLICGTYGFPREEIEAMGVYPNFYDYPYMDGMDSEWSFLFSPYTDYDIMRGEDVYPAPGQFRVEFSARTKEPHLNVWYIDDFWPYAQRVFDAGNTDFVYGRATSLDFFKLDREERAYWASLLIGAGYEMDEAALRERLRQNPSVQVYEIADMPPEESLLLSDDPRILAALDAVEEKFGLTAAQFDRYFYVAGVSEYDTGTTDVVIAPSARRYGELDEPEIEALLQKGQRLGAFIVRLDEDTLVLHACENIPAQDLANDPNAKLLARDNWTADDLPAFEALVSQALAIAEAHPGDERAQKEALYPILIENGEDPALLSLPAIEPEAAAEAAREALKARFGLTDAEFADYYPGEPDIHASETTYYVYLWARQDAPDPWPTRCYCVLVDGETGEATEMNVTRPETPIGATPAPETSAVPAAPTPVALPGVQPSPAPGASGEPLAALTLTDAEGRAVAFEIMDVYYDGSLLLSTLRKRPLGEGYAVSEDSVFGAFLPSYEDIPEGELYAYASSLVTLPDGDRVEAACGSGGLEGGAVYETEAFLFAPDAGPESLRLSYACALPAAPGDEEATSFSLNIALEAPAELSTAALVGGALGLTEVTVAQTDSLAGVYLYFDGETCPVSFVSDGQSLADAVMQQVQFDARRGQRYLYAALEKDGALGPLLLTEDATGARYALDWTNGEVALTE